MATRDIDPNKAGYYTAKRGQTLMNVCQQVYGRIDLYLYFLYTNNKDSHSEVKEGDEFIYDTTLVDENIKSIYTLRGITLVNYLWAFVLVLLVSCGTSKYVPLSNETTDSTIITNSVEKLNIKYNADSVTINFDLGKYLFYMRDTVVISDTIFSKKGNTANVDVAIKDGVLQVKSVCDSADRIIEILKQTIERIRKEKTTVVEEVEKKLNWFEKSAMYIGYGIYMVIILVLLYIVFRMTMRFLKY